METYSVRTKTGIEIKSMTARQAFVCGAVPFSGEIIMPVYVPVLMRLVYLLMWFIPTWGVKDLESADVETIRLACVTATPLPELADGVYAVFTASGRTIGFMSGIEVAVKIWSGLTVMSYQNGIFQTV